MPRILFLGVFLGLTAYAAISDVRGFRIPNAVSLALLGLFLPWAAIVSPDIGFKAHLLIAVLSFAILFMFYAAGYLGAGDVKLITAIMLWAGPEAGLQFILALSIAGAIFAAFLLALGKALRAHARLATFIPSTRVIRWAERGVCPYGIPIFTAAIFIFPLLLGKAPCTAL